MSNAITINDILADKAQARAIAYDVKFAEEMGKPAKPGADYLREYLYTPPGVDTNDSAIIRFEIPLSAPELKAFTGRRQFGKNSAKYVDVTHAPYQYGESEYYKKIASNSFSGFKTAPGRLARLVKTWASRNACLLLNSAESASAWDGVANFCAVSRSTNIFKKSAPTYKNYWAGLNLDTAGVLAVRAEMGQRKDFIGDDADMQGTTLFASPELFPTAEALCLSERLAGGATNPLFRYRLKPKKFMHLAAKRWGMIDDPATEDFPIFAVIEGIEDFNAWGRDSAMFENKAHMGYDIVKDLGVALLRPEALSLAVTP